MCPNSTEPPVQVGPTKIKSYLATIDEAVYTNYRGAELLGGVAKLKWIGFLWLPILLVFVALLQVDRVEKIVLAFIAAGAFIPLHLLSYKNRIRRRLRRLLVKSRGSDQALSSEFELEESGLIFRQSGQEAKLAWPVVAEVIDATDYIEVVTKPSGIAVIPKRIFDDSTEIEAWISYIRQHISAGVE